jgi:hypothetical protein
MFLGFEKRSITVADKHYSIPLAICGDHNHVAYTGIQKACSAALPRFQGTCDVPLDTYFVGASTLVSAIAVLFIPRVYGNKRTCYQY